MDQVMVDLSPDEVEALIQLIEHIRRRAKAFEAQRIIFA
jgi:hypothetical protein